MAEEARQESHEWKGFGQQARAKEKGRF